MVPEKVGSFCEWGKSDPVRLSTDLHRSSDYSAFFEKKSELFVIGGSGSGAIDIKCSIIHQINTIRFRLSLVS